MTFLLSLLNSFFFSQIQNAHFTLKYERLIPVRIKFMCVSDCRISVTNGNSHSGKWERKT